MPPAGAAGEGSLELPALHQHTWLQDTGSFDHLCGNLAAFAKLDVYPEAKKIQLATEDASAHCLGQGSVCLRANGKVQWLHNVLYVPGAANLLSVSRAVGDGLWFVNNAQGEAIEMRNPVTGFSCPIVRENGMYPLEVETVDFSSRRCLAVPGGKGHSCERTRELHERLGHPGKSVFRAMACNEGVNGMSPADLPCSECAKRVCETCVMGKQTRVPFVRANVDVKVEKPLDLLHMDTVGVITPQTPDGAKIILNVVDGFSGMMFASELTSKAEVGVVLKKLITGLEVQTGTQTVRIRSDNGSEFVNHSLREWLDERGTGHDRSAPGNPEQNGVAERGNRTLNTKIRTMLIGAGLPAEYWGEALSAAVMLINITPKKGKQQSRYELFTGRKPTVKFLHRFGCLAYVKLQKHGRFEPVSVAGMFIGYAPNRKAYRVAIGGKCILVSPSVVFDESRNGIDVLRGRDGIPAELRPVPLGGLEPLPGHEEVVNLDQGDSYTLQWVSDDALRPVVRPDLRGEFMDVERRFTSGPSSFPLSQDKEVASHPLNLEDEGNEREVVRHYEDRLRKAELLQAHPVMFPQGRRKQGKKATENVEVPVPSGEDDGRSSEGARMLADHLRRLARGQGEAVGSGPSGRVELPLEREPENPAQEPLDVPACKRVRRVPDRYVPGAYACKGQKVVNGVKIPRSYKEAMSSPEAEQWAAACQEEMDSLDQHGTYELVECPPEASPIPSKWVFDVKTDETGVITRFKARLVAEGNWQIPGVDYSETFAPVASATTRRVFFAVAAEEDWEIDQVDVKTAFLNGTLEEVVYMRQPPGFHSGSGQTVCRLVKSLYGLKQAPRQWHAELSSVFQEIGFTPCDGDPGLFKRETEGESPTFVEVYVDDMLIGGRSRRGVDSTKALLKERFKIHDLGPVKYFLGMLVERDREKRTIKVSVPLKVDELVVKFGLENAAPVDTPMVRGFVQTKLPMHDGEEGKGGSGRLLSPGHKYPELIGSLQYLASNVRPEIAQAVNALSRYRAAPTTAHWNAAIRVVKFLKGTRDDGITYGRVIQPVEGYVDADYAGDADTRESTTGFVYFLNGGPISWASKKQGTVASSTVEAEYLAFHAAAKEGRWLATLLGNFGRPTTRVPLGCDNQGCLANLRNPILSKYVKHIDVAYHSVREWVMRGLFSPWYVNTLKNVADKFTKPLPGPVFARHWNFWR